MTETIVAEVTDYPVTWEKLPSDFELPDDPVENLEHPTLAGDLRELLLAADLVTDSVVIASNFGICARVAGKTVVKAPDWVYIPFVKPLPADTIRKSYTPYAEGDLPSAVMEFLSDKDNGEYSVKPTHPYGKWWFYEQILKVPRYVIFDPPSGRVEVYQLKSGRYSPQIPDANERYWIPSIDLFLGVWQGSKDGRTGYWLRWWDSDGNMLLWRSEKLALDRQQLEQQRKQLEQQGKQLEQQGKQLTRLLELLRRAGISDEELEEPEER
ncbi:MAG: Uma2 family endonuclease [Cyanobacteriota bacterium]|nr:Uma2 family endonuclease [Cyanobacteriota bacterium]